MLTTQMQTEACTYNVCQRGNWSDVVQFWTAGGTASQPRQRGNPSDVVQFWTAGGTASQPRQRGNPSDVVQFWTAGGTASQPRQLEWIGLNKTCVELHWKPPDNPAGFLLHYQVETLA